MYEVGELGVLSSPAYMDRLNHPSPWTAKMMPSYRGMRRGLCEIVARAGHGLGGFGLLLRFGVEAHGQVMLCDWLAGEMLPTLPAQTGLASACCSDPACRPQPRSSSASAARMPAWTGRCW